MIKGSKHSEITCQRLSELAQGRPSPNKGKKGGIPWNKGLKTGPLSDEQRIKLSKSRRLNSKPFTEERKRKISEALKGRHIGGITYGEHRVRKRLEEKGCRVYRKGWPDFLIVEPTGHIRAVEVKRTNPHAFLSQVQREVFDLLRSIGLEIEVVYESNERMSE